MEAVRIIPRGRKNTRYGGLPIIGMRGGPFHSNYSPKPVGMDTPRRYAAVARRRDDISVYSKRLCETHGVDADKQPEKVFILGVAETYSGSPCKCGMVTQTDVHYATPEPGSKNHHLSMWSELFWGLFYISEDEELKGTTTLRRLRAA